MHLFSFVHQTRTLVTFQKFQKMTKLFALVVLHKGDAAANILKVDSCYLNYLLILFCVIRLDGISLASVSSSEGQLRTS